MGDVYVAEDQRLRRRVALKVLPPELAAEPRHLERFKREAWSIAALNHPNIVSIYSVEEAEGLHFLVLELVEGKTLADLLSASPMPLDRMLEIALPLTEALEAAHARGVIHRDLKPRNIMVSHEGRVKVLDFGIARLARTEDEDDTTETSLTRTGGVIGTVSYMSPEQIQERPIDHRSDLFSLGVVLYEMATGQHPFRRKSQLATMAAILCEVPPPPGTLAPDFPTRFDEIVSLCLAKEPFLRYRGAAELRADLLRLVDQGETTDSTVADGLSSLPGSDSNSSAILGATHPRLPARPRCFGREREVRELAEALCNDSLPVPVLGPAGAGKTTITLAALHEQQIANLFGNRRWFVRCDGATGRDSLVGAIARVLCPEAVPPLEPKIFLDLEESPAVLALDNFETPWERDTAAVEELLTEFAAIPGLALVVGLRGEQRPYGPSWREAIHAGPLDPESARSAFLAVAGERFQNDPALDPLLLDLDGLALAVVLLASQAEGEPDLSVLRLRWQERRTALLRRAGARDRQHSLEVSLGLSIDSPRMTEEGRRLLSILGLLPEGAAREDLEVLLPEYGDEAAAVLRKIGLVFDQGSRIRMLAPVREHVRQSYPPQPEDFDRAVDHYMALARLSEKIGGEQGADAAQRLRPEVGNLEPMILAGLERSDPVQAIQAALAYADIVRFTGLGGLMLLESALRVARRICDEILYANCIRKKGDIDLYRARYDSAQSSYEQALSIYQVRGTRQDEAACLLGLGDTYLFRANLRTASRIHEEARSLFHALGHLLGEAHCLMSLGSASTYCSEHETALTYLQEARSLFKEIDNIRGEANCLLQLGHCLVEIQRYEDAKPCFDQALELFRRVGSLLGEANCIRVLGELFLKRGKIETACLHFQKALGLNRRVGSHLGEANCIQRLGDAALACSDYDRAEALLRQAQQQFQRIGQVTGVANCTESLGDSAVAQSDPWKARLWYGEALAMFEQVPQPLSIGRVHLSLAKLAPPGSPERLEHIEAARRVWEEAGVLDQLRSELDAASQSTS
jgi:tetratricopeptide (TPR) repeat protein